MKKWIAALLAMLMVISMLAGCSSKKDEDEGEKTSQTDTENKDDKTEDEDKDEDKDADKEEPKDEDKEEPKDEDKEEPKDEDKEEPKDEEPSTSGEPVGTVMEEPEVLFDGTGLNEFWAEVELKVDDVAMTVEIGLDGLQEDEGIMYIEGEADGEYIAMIIEASEEEYVIYSREKKSDDFALNEAMTEADAEETANIIVEILSLLCIEDWSYVCDELKKLESASAEVYTYEMLEFDEVTGTVSISKTTGLVNTLESEGVSVNLIDCSLSDSNIPSY